MIYRFRLVSVLALISVVLLSACATFQPGSSIIKSPNDNKSYQSLVLENGLQVMLISDPLADKAAASMDISVGSAHDPDEFPGLAHFLEHMLFLGTKKYPEPDEYQKFISEHGGSHNAYTSSENTNYFFDVSAAHLEGALDRFAQQFTAPLFNEEYVDREVHAVHSEFSSKLKSDGRRYFDAIKTSLSDEHPYKRFAVGNLHTLKDREDKKLTDALLDFHKEYYSANLMKLVILGDQDLAQLAKWAEEKFSGIANTNKQRPPFSEPFFDDGFLPAKLEITSIMDKRSMAVAFPIPSPSNYLQSKPAAFLANLIGHEGKGSLLSALKEAELVDSLSAGAHFDTYENAIFMINMGLTQKGLQDTQAILDKLFAYIKLVKEQGIQKMYFDEQVKMLEISFHFQERSDAKRLVRGLANALQHSPAERVLYEGYDLSEFDPALYQRFAEYLRPDNMLITLMAQSVEGKETTQWYETPYTLSAFDNKLAERLTTPQTYANLALPEKNIFIPNEVSLIEGESDEIPHKQYQASGIELWYAQDTSFGTPKTNLFVTLRSPETMKSATHLNQIELMVELLKDSLNEFSYPAYLAGLNYELYNHIRGVTIKISGYNDKQVVLLDQILSTLTDSAFRAERFEIIKERLQRSLENAKDKKPYEQAIATSQRALLNPSWTPDERLTALGPINLEQMEDFRKAFFSVLDVAVLSNGNITAEQATSVAQRIEKRLLSKAQTQAVDRSVVMDLPADTALFDTLSVDHPDTGFVYYMQGGSRSFDERARMTLLSQIFGPAYYADIRTDKQLGYIVFATHYPTMEVPGIAFIVQSPNASSAQLKEETEQFLAGQLSRLKAMETDEFERMQSALISKIDKQDNTLYERSNRYWQEIDRKNDRFDSRQKLIDSVKQQNLESITEYYQTLIDAPGNRLWVLTETDSDATETAATAKGFNPVDDHDAVYFPQY